MDMNTNCKHICYSQQMSINTWRLEMIDQRYDLHSSVHGWSHYVSAHRYLNGCLSSRRESDAET
ncbi:unnamed protein product [Hymenolepis diminuta]|uniref:Uncharacterized protein n=1 Tax=Hymenolepis diminuta TaxID=6216 RepID=A0A564YM20_HYMDI|nr:unnamed protein product [Hymenolepis diminuta]